MKTRSKYYQLLAILLFATAITTASKTTVNAAQTPATSQTGMFVAYGDTRSNADAHAKVVSYIVGLKPEFLIQTGDMVDRGGDASQWQEFDKIEQPITDAKIPDYPARGNHDIGPYYIKHVNQPYLSGDGYYYCFVRLGIRFIVVDCFSSFDKGSDQYNWIEAQLKDAAANHHTAVPFMHESPYSVGPHGDNMDVQQQLHPLFVKYHVPLVFCGHDHLYYRTKRDGVTYVITGGGGAPLYVATNTQFGIPGDVYKTTYNVIKCEVDPETINLTALAPDGSVIDKLSVNR